MSDARTRFTAMELATSWGITIVAHHMVSGRGAPRGFATPERFVDTEWVIGEVERRLAQVNYERSSDGRTERNDRYSIRS